MLNKTLMISGLRLAGASIQFLFNLLIAKSLGADGVGGYYLFLATMMGLAVFAKFGFEHAAVKAVSSFNISGDSSGQKNIWGHYLVAASISSITVIFVYMLVLHGVLRHFDLVSAGKTAIVASLFLYVALIVNCSVLRGLKKPVVASTLEELLLPLVNVTALSLFFLIEDITISVLYKNYMIALSIVMLVSFIYLLSSFNSVPRLVMTRAELKEIFVVASPFLGIASLTYAYNWAGTWVVKYYLDLADVGIYNLSWRLVAISAFVSVAIRSISAPYFASAHAEGDYQLLQKKAVQASMLFIAFSTPVLSVLYIFSDVILGVFGEDFERGSIVIRTMIIGQAVVALCGPVGYLLMMCGEEKKYVRITFVSTVITIVSAIILTKNHGIIGAAAGFSLGIGFQAVVAWLVVYKYLKITCAPFGGRRSHG